MRNSMIFYRSFFEAIKELPKEQKADVYDAIFSYSLDFEDINLTGITKTMFTLIKPQLDANIKRFENGNKQKISKTEAKNKQNGSKTEAKRKQNRSKSEANNNNNNNENNNNNKNVNIEERKSEFYQELSKHINDYSKETLREFFDYWSEENKAKTKMKFELEETWNLKGRLARWKKNDKTNKTKIDYSQIKFD